MAVRQAIGSTAGAGAPLETSDFAERPLAQSERALLPAPMAAAMDLGAVRIVRRFHNPLAAMLNQTVVRGRRIFWAHAPAEATSALTRAHLAHELVHVWQYLALKKSGLELLLDRTYRYSLTPGARFADFGFEQQASIVEDEVRIAAGLAPRWAIGPLAGPAVYAAAIETCEECVGTASG